MKLLRVSIWDVLELCPPGHPNHAASLNNFAMTLQSRFAEFQERNNLDVDITLGQAVKLRPTCSRPSTFCIIYITT